MRPPLLLTCLVIALLGGCSSAATTATPEPPVSHTGRVALVSSTTASGTLWAPEDLPSGEHRAWLDRLDRVVAILAGSDLEPLDREWDGRLVVELPATAEDYTRLAGSGSDEAAAVTRCGDDGSPITVNPGIRSQDDDYLDSLLLHEAVHAATGSACVPGPLWIEEGVAEWLTTEHHELAREANRQWLDHELAAAGVPSGLPADAAFQGTAAQISGGYALATFAVATAVEHLGHQAAMAYFAAPDDATTDRIAGWYLAGLRARLDDPAVSGRR